MKPLIRWTVGAFALTLLSACSPGSADWRIAPDAAIVDFDIAQAETVVQELVDPPFLPEHEQVASGPPRIVSIRMEIVEREVEIAPGVFVWQMAFNNSVPGPVPVVFQWDWVDLTLVNTTTDTIRFGRADNTLVHNIDFHASTGALGGGELTMIGPGQEVGLRWRAQKAGLFVYHCAPGGEMVPYHVVTGGNGAIMVLPREGLRDGYGNLIRYDRAFYFGEQDYYVPMNADGTSQRFDNFAAQMPAMLDVMRGLVPTHIAFNGSYGARTQDLRLEANGGEQLVAPAPDRRARRLGVAGRQVQQHAGRGPRDVGRRRRRDRRRCLHLRAGRGLRLPQPQPDQGVPLRREGVHPRRRRVGRPHHDQLVPSADRRRRLSPRVSRAAREPRHTGRRVIGPGAPSSCPVFFSRSPRNMPTDDQ